ncbi:MAG: c-type cytochrome [Gammaproteobacteria bacterium]|nr:c-type cytochrome [Gammaproteobacteria bacterium]
MKKIGIYAALITMMVSVGGVNAETTIAGGMSTGEGDAKAGKTKSELCQGCHGADGISLDPTTFPNLAGQFAGYIFKQVQDFQLGNRNDDTMSAMAATVTSREDLKDIAAYFATRKQMKGKASRSKVAKSGAKLFKDGNKKLGSYGACIRCHGEKGKGKGKNNSLFPVIGGQQKAYLIKQLKDFKSGKRTNDPAGMMAMVAKGLSNKEIKAVAEYVAGL